MGERQRGLMGPRLFRAFAVSKGDALPHVPPHSLFVGEPGRQGQAFKVLQKVTATPPVPITFFRVKLRFANSAGLHLMWPH